MACRARRLLYVADEIELVLQIYARQRSPHVRIVGELLDAGLPVTDAAISLSGTSTAHHLASDDCGQFRIANLAADSYGLEIEIERRIIDVAPFEVA